MIKRTFGIYEFLVLISLLGMLALLAIRIFNPELLHIQLFYTRAGTFLFGVLFFYFTLKEYKIAKNNEEWAPNRVAGFIRVPLYAAASLFFLYIAVTGSLDA